jgi:excisionase family DNA binding protein
MNQTTNQVTPQPEFLTIEEVAQKLKVTKVTIYRMARKGKIPAVKFGKSWRVSSELITELLKGKGVK